MFTCGLLRSNFSLDIACSSSQIRNCKTRCCYKLLANAAALVLFNHFLRQLVWHFRVVREMHGEIRATLRAAAQIGRITEHLREWHFSANYVYAAAILR